MRDYRGLATSLTATQTLRLQQGMVPGSSYEQLEALIIDLIEPHLQRMYARGYRDALARSA